MSEAERNAERRDELSRKMFEIIAARESPEPKRDWTIFYNEPRVKMRLDVYGITASEKERVCRLLEQAFSRSRFQG